MQASSQQVFEELFREHENNFCFECGSPSNHWASVNNGIFLCLNCSGLHRGFGVNVSFVRSVNMDSWSELQLSMMRNGGNARLRSFFENYNIPKDGPVDFKYRTKAGAYYRDMLKALAENRPLPTAPTLDEGLELISTKNPNYNPQNNAGYGSVKEESNLLDNFTVDNVKTGLITFGGAVATGTKNIATKVTDTVTDPNFKDDVKAFGGKVATGTKEVAGAVADKTKEVWENREEIMAKTTDMAKKGFTAVSGFFSGLTSKGSNTSNPTGPQ